MFLMPYMRNTGVIAYSMPVFTSAKCVLITDH